MSRRSRLLAPVCVAAAFAVAAPAAHAATITFPAGGPVATTVTITDPGPASDSVHLTVTAADPGKLADTRVFFGASQPSFAIGLDGVHEARYDGNGDLAPIECSLYGSTDTFDVPVNHSGASFSADLPKGELISFADIDVAVGIEGVDAPCSSAGIAGLDIDYVNSTQEIDGFSWDLPAAPALSATGGRRQVALSFDQDRGTQYDIYRVIDGVRTTMSPTCAATATTCRSSSTRSPTAARSILARPTRSRSRPRACSCLIACRATIWSGRSAR